MAQKHNTPRWRKYERYIFTHLSRVFPGARIQHDVRREGVISKKRRQIDILIQAPVAGFWVDIVIDCKHFSRKLDIGGVEKFISFLADVKASKGILITNRGYSKAAYNRAIYDSRDVEIRIIDFSDLPAWQPFICIGYSGSFGALISAPDGWVVNLKERPPGMIAFFHRLGVEPDEITQDGLIYCSVWHRDSRISTLKELCIDQDEGLRMKAEAKRIEYLDGPERPEGRTRLRIAELSDKFDLTYEATCFAEFKDVIAFFVLQTTPNRFDEELPSLVWMVEKFVPLHVIFRPDETPVILGKHAPQT